MKLNNRLIGLGLLIIGVLLGVFFCNYSYFEFEKTIKISDLGALVVTSLIGLYITTIVSKALTKNISEKEFLISETKIILEVVNELIALIHEKKLPFSKTVNRFKSVNENLLLLERLLDSSHCKGISVTLIRDELITLRNKVTIISPTNGNIILDNNNYNVARTIVLKMKNLLYNLVFEINRK
ncbi:MAG: hypothetical protein ABI091_30340 [Ferruginibacter sp.]